MAQNIKSLTYGEASEQLEEIIRLAESGRLEIDELTEKLKEARLLIDHCNKKLYATEKEINKILKTDEEEQA